MRKGVITALCLLMFYVFFSYLVIVASSMGMLSMVSSYSSYVYTTRIVASPSHRIFLVGFRVAAKVSIPIFHQVYAQKNIYHPPSLFIVFMY